MPLKRTNLWLDDSQLAQLKAHSEICQMPQVEIVRLAVDAYLSGQRYVAEVKQDEARRLTARAVRVDSQVPMPAEPRRINRAWYRDMKVGESAVVSREDRNRMQSWFHRLGWGFRAVGLEDKTYRVWRVEPTNV